MAPPQSLAVAELARQEGICTATLYNWHKAAREWDGVFSSNSVTLDKWSGEDKFRMVLETAPMSEGEISEYCRQRGCTQSRSKPALVPMHSRWANWPYP